MDIIFWANEEYSPFSSGRAILGAIDRERSAAGRTSTPKEDAPRAGGGPGDSSSESSELAADSDAVEGSRE